MIIFPLQLSKIYVGTDQKYDVEIHISKSSASILNLSGSGKMYVISGTMQTNDEVRGATLVTFHYLATIADNKIKIGNEVRQQFVEDQSAFACWIQDAIGHLLE